MAHHPLLTLWLLAFGLIINIDKIFMSLTVRVLQSDYGWTASQAGDLLSIVYVAFCLATIPSGWLIDRYSYKRYVMASLLLMSFGSILFFGVVSTSATLIPVLLLVLRFITGLGYAGYTNGVPKIIHANYPHAIRGDLQGYVISTIGIGAVITYAIGTPLLEHWKVVYGVLGFLFLILYGLARRLPEPADDHDKAIPPHFKAAWTDRNTLILMVLMIALDMVCMAITNWLPTLWDKKFGLATQDLSLLLSIYALVMSLGVATVSKLRKAFFEGHEGKFIAMCSVLGAALLLSFDMTEHVWISVVTVCGATLLLTWAFGLIWVLPFEYIRGDMLASSFAVINIGGFIGGMLQGTLVGRIVDAFDGSFTPAILMMTGFLVLASALPRFLKKIG